MEAGIRSPSAFLPVLSWKVRRQVDQEMDNSHIDFIDQLMQLLCFPSTVASNVDIPLRNEYVFGWHWISLEAVLLTVD